MREENLFNKQVKIVDHPLAKEILTMLRDENTDQINFRKGLVRLGRLIAYRITEDFDIVKTKVRTPLGIEAEGIKIPDMNNIVIIHVLRASMPLVEGMIKVFPMARQGVVSARRVEEKGMSKEKTFEIEVRYVKIPRIRPEDNLIIADPMFATGSTAMAVTEKVLSRGEKPKRLILATVISTRLGIERFLSKYSEALVYTVSIDPELNEKGYIVPGLGDAGDRAFGE